MSQVLPSQPVPDLEDGESIRSFESGSSYDDIFFDLDRQGYPSVKERKQPWKAATFEPSYRPKLWIRRALNKVQLAPSSVHEMGTGGN